MQAYLPSTVLPQQDIIVTAWLKCFNELSSTCDKHLYPGLGCIALDTTGMEATLNLNY